MADPYDEEIIRIINNHKGMKAGEIVAYLEFETLRAVRGDLPYRIQRLGQEGRIVIVDYVLPDDPGLIHAFCLPAKTVVIDPTTEEVAVAG